jgi:hypothetical protein
LTKKLLARLNNLFSALEEGYLTDREAFSLLEKPLMDYSKHSAPMDNWYVLFDPAASLVETQGYGYKGEQNGARVDTIYSLGESIIREGKHEETVYVSSFGSHRLMRE